jgi:molybdopterin molybdotransferase
MLSALVSRDGGVVVDDSIVPDNPASILAAMNSDVDVVLVSGGSSVGQEDHAPRLVAEHGDLAIHGVAMRPSSPSGMGTIGNRFVFLLPGNPVSCLCSYDFFASRCIRQLAGLGKAWPYVCEPLRLSRKLVSQVGRVDYARVSVVDGRVIPIAISGASVLSSTTRADGFVVVPADSEGFPPDTVVDVWRYG